MTSVDAFVKDKSRIGQHVHITMQTVSLFFRESNCIISQEAYSWRRIGSLIKGHIYQTQGPISTVNPSQVFQYPCLNTNTHMQMNSKAPEMQSNFQNALLILFAHIWDSHYNGYGFKPSILKGFVQRMANVYSQLEFNEIHFNVYSKFQTNVCRKIF